MPDFDTQVTVNIGANAPILVDQTPTALADLANTIEMMSKGKRAKVAVYVQPPAHGAPAFLHHVRAVQAKIRKAKEPVLVAYYSVPAEQAS